MGGGQKPWELGHSLGLWKCAVLETEQPWGRGGLGVGVGQWNHLISGYEVGIIISAHFADEETESQVW